MNRLTKKIGLVLISSSLVLSGCGQNESEDAEGGDASWGKDSAAGSAGSGSHVGNFSSHSPFYTPGYQHYSNGGSHPSTGFFSSFSGGSVRGGFGASAHGGSS